MNLFNKSAIRVQNDGLTQRQRDYGLLISTEDNWDGMSAGSRKNFSYANQLSQNLNAMNEIYGQQILLKSEKLIRSKLGDRYPNIISTQTRLNTVV